MMAAVEPLPADPSVQKLVNVLGPDRAREVYVRTMESIGAQSLERPDDRFAFGCALMKFGGVLEAIGRAIKIQAILLGAKER
jgi:hypothetical protein